MQNTCKCKGLEKNWKFGNGSGNTPVYLNLPGCFPHRGGNTENLYSDIKNIFLSFLNPLFCVIIMYF